MTTADPAPQVHLSDAGPAPEHVHVWRPYEDTDLFERCAVDGCGVDRAAPGRSHGMPARLRWGGREDGWTPTGPPLPGSVAAYEAARENARQSTRPLTLGEELVEQALHLCVNGERAPGCGPWPAETWPEWARRAERWLRSRDPAADCTWCAGSGEVLVVPVHWGTPQPAKGRRTACLCVLAKEDVGE